MDKRKMELFDKRFVHFMWNEELKGKTGFFADDVCDLISCVMSGDINRTSVKESIDKAFPFMNTAGHNYKFFYYDPNYDCKRAYNEGKQIQFLCWSNNVNNPFWVDVAGVPLFGENEYRIKPEEPKRMTFRQLAEWVAKGNGEQTTPLSGSAMVMVSYAIVCEDKEVPDTCRIRRWGSDEWVVPTVDIYFEDCKEVSK